MSGLVIAGCAGTTSTSSKATTATTGSGPATGTPLVLGAVGSNSGTEIFPEPMRAAQAVFDRLNKNGGINGHPIQYLVEDDGNSADQAAIAAKRLVEEKKVLGLVGGGSVADCTTNAKYYASKQIYSLPGANSCVDSPTVAEINTGPFIGLQVTMSYMIDTMKAEPLCLSALDVPLTDYIKGTVGPEWERITGHKVKEFIISEPYDDLTTAVTKAKSDGCKGVVLAYTETNLVAYLQIAQALGLTNGEMKYGTLASGYSLNLLGQVGAAGEGVVTNSEFLPFTEDESKTPALADFRKLMKETGQKVSGFGQAGYIAANIAIAALHTIQGDYTVESVGNAFKNVKFSTPLLGSPFTWSQQPNRSSKIVQIKGGKFVTISDWLEFPPK
jgi:branched-chain amino acid transport system substrate-binding protein